MFVGEREAEDDRKEILKKKNQALIESNGGI